MWRCGLQYRPSHLNHRLCGGVAYSIRPSHLNHRLCGGVAYSILPSHLNHRLCGSVDLGKPYLGCPKGFSLDLHGRTILTGDKHLELLHYSQAINQEESFSLTFMVREGGYLNY